VSNLIGAQGRNVDFIKLTTLLVKQRRLGIGMHSKPDQSFFRLDLVGVLPFKDFLNFFAEDEVLSIDLDLLILPLNQRIDSFILVADHHCFVQLLEPSAHSRIESSRLLLLPGVHLHPL